MNNQKTSNKRVKIKRLGKIIFKIQFLLITTIWNLPSAVAVEKPVLSIVYSQENASQWRGITSRLEASGIGYCIVPLSDVKSATDLGDRQVLFLPNIETLSPSQAIALEEWMGKGGKLIASGPTGSLSAPGVRRLLRSLLGGYWGFSLDGAKQLQASATDPSWVRKDGLSVQVRGGVIVPEGSRTQKAAVWNSQDNPAAVLTTRRSTFFGWRWGVDAASAADVDTAWLNAAIQRYSNSSNLNKIAGTSPNCINSVVSLPKTTARKIPPLPKEISRPTTFRVTTNSNTQPTRFIRAKERKYKSQDPIDQIQDRVNIPNIPPQGKPISRTQAIALQQDLRNLIGRVESAQLAANVRGGSPGVDPTITASIRSGAISGTEQALSRARNVLQLLPKLVAQNQYDRARQQWLAAKSELWKQFPINRPLAQPEIRAIWLDRGTIVKAQNEQGLAKIFDKLKKAGINTVFFETLNSSYTVYPSRIAPEQNPLTRGWDPLASGVKLAKKRGIELHAWVWVFAAGNQRHNKILNLDPNYPGPALASNPSWVGYDNKGNTIPPRQDKPFFDPANPQLRQYLLSLYEEIVTKYEVDGLHLDYIRYPFQDPKANRTYGYGVAARQQFQQKWGVDPAKISPEQHQLRQKWTAFRTQQVDSFVAEVSQKLRQKKPNIILSAAVFPLPKQERIQKLQQHWELWAIRGDIDLIVPMTYARDTNRFERLAQPWINSRQLGSTLVVPGIRLLNLSALGTFDQIQLVRDLPTSGYALFAAENLDSQLEKIFSNTQGTKKNQKEPIPLREPFKTAKLRYVVLQSEWDFLIENQQLTLPKSVSSKFKNQVQILARALDRLAKKPNKSNLVVARASLTRFKSQYRTWIYPYATNHPYQVKAWENRLITIDRLLQYGQRVKLK
ncbi:MAG: family 10 glycosylhydrolase [Cyanobacteria bacterium P01_A01_bin.84]